MPIDLAMNFLSADNPFFRVVLKIIHMIFISFLWLMCCLPVFTIGASTSALYYTVERNIKHDLGYPASMFFRSFKRNFKQSTLIWLVMFGLMLVFSFDWTFFTNYGNDGHPAFLTLRHAFAVLLVIELLLFLYIFPYISRFEQTTKQSLQNVCLLMIRHPLRLLTVCFFFAFAIFMIWFMPFLIFIFPAIYMWQAGFIFEKIYALYMSEEDRQKELARNTPGIPDNL